MLPNKQRVEELLRGRKREVPRLAIEINVLDVSTNCNGPAFADTAIDLVAPERVDSRFLICQSLVAARLKGDGITLELCVKGVDRRQDGAGVFARSAIIGVDCLPTVTTQIA